MNVVFELRWIGETIPGRLLEFDGHRIVAEVGGRILTSTTKYLGIRMESLKEAA